MALEIFTRVETDETAPDNVPYYGYLQGEQFPVEFTVDADPDDVESGSPNVIDITDWTILVDVQFRLAAVQYSTTGVLTVNNVVPHPTLTDARQLPNAVVTNGPGGKYDVWLPEDLYTEHLAIAEENEVPVIFMQHTYVYSVTGDPQSMTRQRKERFGIVVRHAIVRTE